MARMMKAQVVESPNNMVLKEVPVPEITDDEVLIKVKYCGICGSDWSIYTGKYAAEILGRHIESSTPVGKTSPFALLPEYDGQVLMLGCGLRPNTSMHGVEELSVPPYLLREEPVEYTLIDADGNELKKKYRVHNFRGVAQRYDRLAEVMDIPHGKVLEAEAYLIDAREMWKKGHEKLKENEMYFVDRT